MTKTQLESAIIQELACCTLLRMCGDSIFDPGSNSIVFGENNDEAPKTKVRKLL